MLGMLDKGKEVSETIGEVKCEMLLLTGLGELYDNPFPDSADVVNIIKWTQAYDRIDTVFNRTWMLAKAIEGIVLKNA